MKRSLEERVDAFAQGCMALVEHLPTHQRGQHLADQLYRSSSRAGSFYHEARGASTLKDMRYKMAESSKEMREARFWLGLIIAAGWPAPNAAELHVESTELVAMLTAACKTLRSK